MIWLSYATAAVAIFFAGSWTLGVLTNPEYRLKATVAGLVCWWVLLSASYGAAFHILHLWWLFPASMFLAQTVMQTDMMDIRSMGSASTAAITFRSLVFATIMGGIARIMTLGTLPTDPNFWRF